MNDCLKRCWGWGLILLRGAFLIPVGPAGAKEMKVIRGVYGASRLGWNRVLSFMASGQIRVAPLITHRLLLEQVDQGFRACQERKAMKVVLLPS